MYSDENYMSFPLEIEKELNSFFRFKKPKVIFDIGSCDGLDSIKYARFFRDCKVYSFEPLEKNIVLINSNIDKFKVQNVIVEKLALSDQVGKSVFYLSSGKPSEFLDVDWDFGNKSSSLLEPNLAKELLPWLEFNETIEVDTNTIFDYCKSNQISLIDFIHMDVQGAELLVLEGSKDYINKIKLIWLEVENMELYKNQPLKNDVENFLLKKGFTKIKDTVNHIAGDQLWVNYNFFPRKKLTRNIYNLLTRVIG